MSSKSALIISPLVSCANELEYQLYRAALEWDLIDPIVIESKEDLHSQSTWQARLTPFDHQVTNLISYCKRLPVTLLADDVGLGKTISAGLIVSELIARKRVRKFLIVCPKLLMPQWREELETKFGIWSVDVSGAKLRSTKLEREIGALITTYQSCVLYFDKLKEAGFDMLILDEAHKLRNLYGVAAPPKVALCFRDALEKRHFKFVLMLTATPIQNRLWDLYSLIDLLTVARGHTNPFGSESMFAREFIADDPLKARQLNPRKREEFRSIVYSYMSRVRRADANLYFPERIVQLHKVNPLKEEVQLHEILGRYLPSMDILTQISVLRAFISSPHALSVQLKNMAERYTVHHHLAQEVSQIVASMTTTAKLDGLGCLLDSLSRERGEDFRAVIFTTRRETQKSIELFLQKREIPCGLINGTSGSRNQATLTGFRKTPPSLRVIVSTEAGSEGINLQCANVLINFDLPWNPMVVEQRIGRIQRLASNYASVCIFNIILAGTFEEYIVARLLEKLQMASSAIGDVESLLEAAELDGGAEGQGKSFEDKIRLLVIASLAGRDTERATKLAEESIVTAKAKLESSKQAIDSIFGSMGNLSESGPRSPKLERPSPSLGAKEFVHAAIGQQGGTLTSQANGTFVLDHRGRREVIRLTALDSDCPPWTVSYELGSSAFERLVATTVAKGRHNVTVKGRCDQVALEKISRNWCVKAGVVFDSTTTIKRELAFEGTALIRLRASVGHDSYERLVDVECPLQDRRLSLSDSKSFQIENPLREIASLGLNLPSLITEAKQDPQIQEFCRFYVERREVEVAAAQGDDRKQKKLSDEFTPTIEASLVGLSGNVGYFTTQRVRFWIDDQSEFSSTLEIADSDGQIAKSPELAKCAVSGVIVPIDCLEECAISKRKVLRNKLVCSSVSDRRALPEYLVECSVTRNLVLVDEVEKSSVTSAFVTKKLLRRSGMSGKKAEPEFITECEFTLTPILLDESAVSQVSGKRFRIDQSERSEISGTLGHATEFVRCSQIGQALLLAESERCELTGKIVTKGLLQECQESHKRVVSSELDTCSVTGKRVLKNLLVESSLSGDRLLSTAATRSSRGSYCTPSEARTCEWSDEKGHPDDFYICELTGALVKLSYMTKGEYPKLKVLLEMLNGECHRQDSVELWEAISRQVSSIRGGGSAKVVCAVRSPSAHTLAVCAQLRTWGGLKTRHCGLIYSVSGAKVLGRLSHGRRSKAGWVSDNSD